MTRFPETKEVKLEFLLLTKSTAFIIGPVATVLGWIMDFIYNVCSAVGIQNIGLCIILFTVITNLLMLPLTIKQQKFSKMNAVMNPEIQAIQAKYKDKKDQVSMQKQQAEMQAVYEKYGSSPTSGCLPMLVQLPIMFALYRVIWNIPAYIGEIKGIYMQVATPLQNLFTSQTVIESYTGFVELANSNNLPVGDKYNYTEVNRIIDLLYQFDQSEWTKLSELFPDLSSVINSTAEEVIALNNFLGGINLMEAPGFKLSIALIIPILAGLTQWISTKVLSAENPSPSSDKGEPNTAAATMKSMNTIMPLMSVFMCITLPSCIGIYWVASSVVRTVIQLFVNHSMKNVEIEDIIRANIEKQNKKREKQGLPPISADASIRTSQRAKEIVEKNQAIERERQEKLKQLKEQGKMPETNLEKVKPGSIAAKAASVKAYNERNAKK